ncbi:hypothetical protein CAG70_02575 [Photobacterium halotolerans]|uniref:Uncharacterized protein n=2 Tax=Photobacterium halotolerans TaxID=265726 RepID=A0A7X4WES9_9GAMM|nr:hypothetical protein [Photobacterium halotolerans]NAX45888.1 hypothetical protein [Photobacterium halotolerans]
MTYTTLLISALLGAQMILTLVLTKGEICPGQRGRVHKMLPVLLLGWLIACINQPVALLPLLGLAWFTFQVKTGKTRDQGPLKLLYASCAMAVLSWLMTLSSLSWAEKAQSLVAVVMFGAALAHLLLTQSRTRLQAFHRVLPAAGLVSAILSVLLFSGQLYSIPQAQVESQLLVICAALLLLIAAQVIWVGHIVLAKPVKVWQLSGVLLLLSASAGCQLSVF